MRLVLSEFQCASGEAEIFVTTVKLGANGLDALFAQSSCSYHIFAQLIHCSLLLRLFAIQIVNIFAVGVVHVLSQPAQVVVVHVLVVNGLGREPDHTTAGDCSECRILQIFDLEHNPDVSWDTETLT